jgi:membrane protein required for colicin V production
LVQGSVELGVIVTRDSGTEGERGSTQAITVANWIDLTVIAVLSLFGLRGYFRGLFREVLSLIGLLAGFFIASRYSDAAADWAAAYWKLTPFLLKGIAFIALFFAVHFLFNLAGWLLHRSAGVLFLKTVNRVGGVAMGIGKGTAIVALLVLFLTSASWLPGSTRAKLEGALLIGPLSQLGGGILRMGKERLLTTQRKGDSGFAVTERG